MKCHENLKILIFYIPIYAKKYVNTVQNQLITQLIPLILTLIIDQFTILLILKKHGIGSADRKM